MPPTPRSGASSRPHRSTQAAYPTQLSSTQTTFNSAHPSTSAPRYRPTLVSLYGSTTDYPLATQDVVDQTRHEEALRKLREVGGRGPDEVSKYIYPEEHETHLDVNLRRGLAQKITTECSELFYCSPCGKSVSLLDKRGAPQHFETKLHVMAVKRAAGLSGDAELRIKYMILRPCPGLNVNCKQSHHRYDHPCIRGVTSKVSASAETSSFQAVPAMGRPRAMVEDDDNSSRHQVIADSNLSPVSASSSMGPVTPPPPYQDLSSQPPAHMLARSPYGQNLANQQLSMSTAAQPYYLQGRVGPLTPSVWYGAKYGYKNVYGHSNYIEYEYEEYQYGYQTTPYVATATSIALAAMSAPKYNNPIEAMGAPINTGAASHSAPEALTSDQPSILLAAGYAYDPISALDSTHGQLELPILTPEENDRFAFPLNFE